MRSFGLNDGPPPNYDNRPWWFAIGVIVLGIIMLISYQHLAGLYS